MFEVFFTHVKEKVLLTSEEESLVKNYFIPKIVRKRQYLLQAGDLCRYLCFVEKGLLKSYNIDDKGNQHIIQFAWEGWWIADTYSFLSGENAGYNIDAIDDSELLMINLAHFEEMVVMVPKMERYFRILFQNNIISKEKRLIISNTYTAEEKYLNLTTFHPQIIQRIPQNLVASYLGITPETLSRIRKNIIPKK